MWSRDPVATDVDADLKTDLLGNLVEILCLIEEKTRPSTHVPAGSTKSSLRRSNIVRVMSAADQVCARVRVCMCWLRARSDEAGARRAAQGAKRVPAVAVRGEGRGCRARAARPQVRQAAERLHGTAAGIARARPSPPGASAQTTRGQQQGVCNLEVQLYICGRALGCPRAISPARRADVAERGVARAPAPVRRRRRRRDRVRRGALCQHAALVRAVPPAALEERHRPAHVVLFVPRGVRAGALGRHRAHGVPVRPGVPRRGRRPVRAVRPRDLQGGGGLGPVRRGAGRPVPTGVAPGAPRQRVRAVSREHVEERHQQRHGVPRRAPRAPARLPRAAERRGGPVHGLPRGVLLGEPGRHPQRHVPVVRGGQIFGAGGPRCRVQMRALCGGQDIRARAANQRGGLPELRIRHVHTARRQQHRLHKLRRGHVLAAPGGHRHRHVSGVQQHEHLAARRGRVRSVPPGHVQAPVADCVRAVPAGALLRRRRGHGVPRALPYRPQDRDGRLLGEHVPLQRRILARAESPPGGRARPRKRVLRVHPRVLQCRDRARRVLAVRRGHVFPDQRLAHDSKLPDVRRGQVLRPRRARVHVLPRTCEFTRGQRCGGQLHLQRRLHG